MTAPADIGEFVLYLAAAIGAQGFQFDHDEPLARLAIGDSLTLTELAIVLEQELGIDLPDDLDLRSASFASLYTRYAEARYAEARYTQRSHDA